MPAIFLRIPFVFGVVLAATASAMMAGWIFRIHVLIELPGYRMVFATAAGFAVAGVALASICLPSLHRMRFLAASGGAVALLGAAVLAQYLFGWNLGVDAHGLHAWLATTNPHPGRPAIATAIGFVCAGAAFIALGRSEAIGRVLIALQALVALGALGGNVLELGAIYPSYPFAEVSFSTAVAFALLAFGQWRALPMFDDHQPFWRDDAARILATGATLVLGVGAVGAVGGFLAMQNRAEAVLQSWLAENLASRATLVRDEAAERLRNAGLYAASLTIRRQMKAALAPDARPQAIAELERIGEGILKGSGVSFRFVAPDGRELARGGAEPQRSALRAPVPGKSGSFVSWNGRFELESRNEITDAGEFLGALELRQPLRNMAWTDIWQDIQVRFCAAEETTIQCFPARGAPQASAAPFGKTTTQMMRALSGQSGVLRGRDLQGIDVIAAYAPLAELGLGVVANVQTRDVFAPLRGPLAWLGLLIAALCTAAVLLLFRSVVPLVQRLASSERKLNLALAGSQLALFEADPRTGVVTLGEQWNAMRGGEPRAETTTVAELAELLHPEEAPQVWRHALSALKGEISHYDIEHRVRKLDGGWMWVRSRGEVAGRDRNGRALRMVGTNAEITERKRRELSAMEAAAHDPLTGLPNRRLFDDRLRQALARARRSAALLAVLYVDADKFKLMNDNHGHATGDALLKRFGIRLAACVRSTDTVARLGGDEFAVVLEGLPDEAHAHAVAQKIVAALHEPFVIEGRQLGVSASVGVAVLTSQDGFRPESLLERADRALYQAKHAGRDRYALAA